MANKKTEFGKVLKNVQGYDLRVIPEFSGRGKERKQTGSTIGVFKGKKVVKTDFKNQKSAVEYINTEILKLQTA